ncbi:uncharacterized protein TNCV_2250391 [Trichonephila clavipes]|nr:uncharacterized protein TNCV_2250391 [Trichonephila clavipes]
MDATCQLGTVQVVEDSVRVWGVCSSCNMGPLIRLDTTLTGDRYVSILSDHLRPYTCPLCITTNLGNFIRTMRHPTRPELLQSGSRGTLLNLDTSACDQNTQTRTLLNISGMPCNVLFREEISTSSYSF